MTTKKNKGTKKVVKGWMVVGSRTGRHVEFHPFEDVARASIAHYPQGLVEIVPCTFSYTLPAKKKI